MSVKSKLRSTKRIIKQYFRLLRNISHLREDYKVSYSQCGEDLIIKFIFDDLGILKPSYIDIGAHNPTFLNNTQIFYLSGSSGINIEPDPTLFRSFEINRKHDVNLNIGIADKKGEMDFYLMSTPTLNTFSKEETNRMVEFNYHISCIKKIKVDTITNIIQKYRNNVFPDFLSLDVEGLDELILKSIDYETSSPTVICVETISYSENGGGKKNRSIINFLESKEYLLFADTYINSIFVKKDKWIRSKR